MNELLSGQSVIVWSGPVPFATNLFVVLSAILAVATVFFFIFNFCVAAYMPNIRLCVLVFVFAATLTKIVLAFLVRMSSEQKKCQK